MKKTLFLSAILGAALCSSAFAATAISVGENETRDISTELTEGTGIELTLANGATVTNTSKSYGSGSGDWGKQLTSVTLASGATATLDVSGTANSTGVGLVRSGLGEVGINLNGGTLVKTGTGQTIVYHVTTGDSVGTIQVDNGRLCFDGTGYAFHGANANLVVNEHGSLYFNNLESTMKTLTSGGEVIVASSGGTKVNGTFTTNTGSTTTINNGKTLTVKGLNTTGGIIQGAGTLFVDADATANNTTLDFDYISKTAGTKLTLKQAHGTLKAADAAIVNAITLTNGDYWAAAEWVNVEGSSYTFSGAISGSGNQVFSGKDGLKEVALTFNGNLSGWNSNGDGYKGLRAASGMTLNVTIGGSLEGDAAKVANAFNADNGSKMNLTIDRDATLNGNLRITSLTINEGKAVDLNMAVLSLSSMTLGSGSTAKFHSSADWAKSEVALTSGNGYGHVGISKTLGYTVTDNGATVTVDDLAATLTGNVLSSTTTEETNTYYINAANQDVVINKSGEISLNAGTYNQTNKVVIGTNGAAADAGTILTVDGTTSVSTTSYVEVYHNSTLALKDTAHVSANSGANLAVWLHNGSSITMESGATLTSNGVDFKGGSITATGDTQIGGGQGTPANATITGSDITVTSGSIREYNISGGSVTVNSGTTTNINSALSDTTDLTVNSGSTANLNAADTKAEDVTVNGDLTVKAASTVKQLGGLGTVKALADLTVTEAEEGKVTLGGMEIAGNTTVTVNDHAGTLTLGSLTVTGSGSTINANLDLSDATVTLNGNSVTLGCDLKFDGTAITLSDDDIAAISGAGLLLFSDVESLTLGTTTHTTDYIGLVDASGIILTLAGDATSALPDKVFVNFSATDKTVSLSVVPEPATATLSLLALAALASRRRRK